MKLYTNIKAFDSIKIAKTYRIYYIKSSARKQLSLRTTFCEREMRLRVLCFFFYLICLFASYSSSRPGDKLIKI